jgi:hypothetical protein
MRKNIGYVKKSRLRTKAGSKRKVKGNFPKALWFIYPAIYIFIIQFLAFGSVVKGFVNTFMNPYTFMLSYLIITGLSFILWLFFENRWVSFSILNLLGIIIALGNRFTIPQGETGLAFNNLGIFNELGLIQNAKFNNFIPFIIMLLIFIPLLYVVIYFMHQWKEGLKYRRIVATVAFFVFMIFSQLIVPLISTSRTTLSNVDKLGVIVFFNNGIFGKDNIKYPDKEQVAEIMAKVDLKQDQPITKPNIIMLQLTNFVDLERVLNLKVEALNNYKNTFTESTKFIVDLSAKQNDNLNIEFEVLAGLPVEFHPNEYQVRNGNTREGTISLGGILSRQGYDSLSILPYPKNDRNSFYKKLSFDRFISEDDLGKGTSTEVLAEIEKQLANSTEKNKPVFIYSHLNVLENKYEENTVDRYIQDLKILDDQLAILYQMILDTKKPTIVLLYSDNLPVLGLENKLYYESGYLSTLDSNMELKQKISSGDMMIWDNYNQGSNYSSGEKFDLCSIPFLLLSEVDYPMPNYLQYFHYLKDQMKLSRISSDYLEIGNVLFANDTDEYRSFSKEFSIIIKDILGPYKYVEENLKLWSK